MITNREDPMKIQDRQLCYVEDNRAYFTSDPENEWGDDWNDIPYEHNAGPPYGNADITIVYFTADLIEPSYGCRNSSYSVESINRGAIPWLRSASWAQHEVRLHAGDTLRDFITKVESSGGIVYLNAEDHEALQA